MKILDLNILIYAVDSKSSRHGVARPWLDSVISSTETIGIPSMVAVGFIRLTTSARIMESPLDPETAVSVVRGWYARRNVIRPEPTERHFEVLGDLLAGIGAGGNLVNDAHLAVLSLEYGAELCSFDRDFGRFAGVRLIEPAV